MDPIERKIQDFVDEMIAGPITRAQIIEALHCVIDTLKIQQQDEENEE